VPGKSADFIVLDKDIVGLGEAGQVEAIASAHVPNSASSEPVLRFMKPPGGH